MNHLVVGLVFHLDKSFYWESRGIRCWFAGCLLGWIDVWVSIWLCQWCAHLKHQNEGRYSNPTWWGTNEVIDHFVQAWSSKNHMSGIKLAIAVDTVPESAMRSNSFRVTLAKFSFNSAYVKFGDGKNALAASMLAVRLSRRPKNTG